VAELDRQLKSGLGDPTRPIVARPTQLVDTAGEETFDRHVGLAKRLLRTAHAGVHLIDDACVLFKRGVAVPAASPRSIPLGEFCSYTVTSGAPLLVNDSRADPRFEHHSAVHDVDLIAYAGVPILTRDGHVLGTFCVTDNKPREWNEEDLEVLRHLAAAVATEIDLRVAYAAASHDAELSKAREDALTLALDATGRRGLDVGCDERYSEWG
jgi:GAF domain-containing protein